MKKTIIALFTWLAVFQASPTFSQNLHKLNFKTVEEMYDYFKYAPGKKVISGHRGTIEEQMPENSIAAMEAVLKHTSAIFEIDPRLTKDAVPIMVHDATLERTTTGTGKVADFTWKELQKLKLKDHKGKGKNHLEFR